MDACYQDLGRPPVTFESFWNVYIDLRDRVDATIPLDIVTSLNQSIFSEHEEDDHIEFALEHLKAPELDMRNAVEVDEEEEDIGEGTGGEDVDVDENGDDLFQVSFTLDIDQDQLY